MSNFTFNNAKGKVAYYATLPGADDALVLIPLNSSGLEVELTMIDYVTLEDLLAGSSNEQLTMGRKTLANVTAVVDGDTMVVDCDDVVFVAASGPAVGAFVVCYMPDVAASADANILLLTKHDFSAIPSGTDIPVQISADGLFIASSPL